MGKIGGVVLDANDAVVVNAKVKIENAGIRRRVRSDGEGEFAAELPAGNYRITVEAHGFRRFVSPPLEVRANATRMIDIRLEVAEPRGLVPASPSGVG